MKSLLLATLLLLGLRPVLAQRLVTRDAPLAAGQAVVLDLKYAHQIRVRPGTGPRLVVQAQVTIADHQLDQSYGLAVATAGGEVSVTEKLDLHEITDYWRHDHGHSEEALRIDYDVTLPAGTALRLRTISGNLDLSDLSGAITAKTISGDVLLRNLTGALIIRTVSGDVRLTAPGRGPIDALTVSGDVEANWPPAQPAELSLKSISGEVYADSSVTFSNLKARSYVGYELRGHTGHGEGGPLVTLHTVSGDVFFRKR